MCSTNKLHGSMLLLPGKRAGAWVRQMRYLLQPAGDALHCNSVSVARFSNRVKILSDETESSEDGPRFSPLTHGAYPTGLPFMNLHRNIHNQDLRRFLEEVGTNPKEARYWLKHFQRSTDSKHPFAVIHVDSLVFQEMDMMDKLSSGVAFLHRNNMKCVMVHGDSPASQDTTHATCKKMRKQLNAHSFLLANCLESHGVAARPLFPGCGVFQASSRTHPSQHTTSSLEVNIEPVVWALHSNHVPILQNIAETDSGQLLVADIADIMLHTCGVMEPRKVLWVNTTGGFTDDQGEVIANINLPVDWQAVSQQSWCTSEIERKIHMVGELLSILPQQSSVVITAASILLNELFTHHGSGTFFKIMEPIHVYNNFDDIDQQRFFGLINKSFGRQLRPGYIEDVKDRVHTIYLSEGYNAAAVVLMEPGCNVPYLDKFAVSLAKQGEGVADVLMAHLQQDFSKLFWRSKGSNIINSWYFKHSDGSWGDRDWIVFWYGIANHRESSSLVDFALKKEASFL